MMKTSFTKTFSALSHNKKPCDEAFNRPTSYTINDETNNPIVADDIFVINSYEDEYFSPNSAKLMVKKDLKKSYDDVMEKIQLSQYSLEEALKEYFNSKEVDFAKEITSLYDISSFNFLFFFLFMEKALLIFWKLYSIMLRMIYLSKMKFI